MSPLCSAWRRNPPLPPSPKTPWFHQSSRSRDESFRGGDEASCMPCPARDELPPLTTVPFAELGTKPRQPPSLPQTPQQIPSTNPKTHAAAPELPGQARSQPGSSRWEQAGSRGHTNPSRNLMRMWDKAPVCSQVLPAPLHPVEFFHERRREVPAPCSTISAPSPPSSLRSHSSHRRLARGAGPQ